jgi:hypothetical protein
MMSQQSLSSESHSASTASHPTPESDSLTSLVLPPTGQDGSITETDPYVSSPYHFIPPNPVISRRRTISSQSPTVEHTALLPDQPEEIQLQEAAPTRGPHDRPPPLATRPNSFSEGYHPERSSIPNPYSPLPPTRASDARQNSTLINPYSPMPPVRPDERPLDSRMATQPTAAQPLPDIVIDAPAPHDPIIVHPHPPRRASPPSAYVPPRGRTISGPAPSPAHNAHQYEPPIQPYQNINLNRSSPDVRTQPLAGSSSASLLHPSRAAGPIYPPSVPGAPSIRTNGSHVPLAPRHIPRRLVMPTPLAPQAPLPPPSNAYMPPIGGPPPLNNSAPPYLPPGAAPPGASRAGGRSLDLPPVRRVLSPPQAQAAVRYDPNTGAQPRNLLRKQSSTKPITNGYAPPPAPAPAPLALSSSAAARSRAEMNARSGSTGGNNGGGGGFLAILGFGKAGQKPEMREVRAPVGAGPSAMEIRRVQTVKAPTAAVKNDPKPRRFLSKRR